MELRRRTFLGAGLAAGAAALSAESALADPHVRDAKAAKEFGPLISQGDLALPEGFRYHRVRTIGVEPLLDGPGGQVVGVTPGNLDGTGSFKHGRTTYLVQNHELRPGAEFPVPHVEGTVYDESVVGGGCTVVQVDRDGVFEQQWVANAGTIRNCAGGETMFGSWLTCEETSNLAGTDYNGVTLAKDHGYTFEVFPAGPQDQVPVPIYCWGRAVWEGAAVDPSRRYAYLTEDTGRGLFYRWTAPDKITSPIALKYGKDDGVLEAAAIIDPATGEAFPNYSTMTSAHLGMPMQVRWVRPDIEDRQAQTMELRDQFTGVTRHRKIEGCWDDGKGLWFTCSYAATRDIKDGAVPNQGQVFFYRYADETLTLMEHYEIGSMFDGPDNITVSPFGTITLAEDGDDAQHLIDFSPATGSQAIARNELSDTEWAGPVWDHQGRILFGSIQDTATYAISGPWKRYLRG